MIEKFLKVAVRAAKRSGEIQMAKLGRVKKIKFKGEINLVTEVDHLCEKEILRVLGAEFPDHAFLTEESGALEKRGAEFRWIIDPLDGTTNYSHSYPLFCTSIALEHRGEAILGVVYEPNLNQLFYAIRTRGAFLNKKRIRISRISRLKRALLSTGFAYNVKRVSNNNLNHFGNFIKASQAVRRDGVAAIDLCYVACGRFDGFWELGLWPWDVAAGALIVKEAGGRVTLFDGSPLEIHGKEIVASNGRIHTGMLEVLKRGR